jgi:hypothetical protein
MFGQTLKMAVAVALALQVFNAISVYSQPEAAKTTDAELFFERYHQAVGFVRQNRPQEARAVMDMLVKDVSRSPWIEIGMLKTAQLNETGDSKLAMEMYELLLKRLGVAPYFEGQKERAAMFKTALEGSIQQGIRRIRISRIRAALAEYHARYAQYPESLAKLSILGYLEVADTQNTNGQFFRYVPTGQTFSPTIRYQQYELESVPPEPFITSVPRVESTSMYEDNPPRYEANIRASSQREPETVREDQKFGEYLVVAVASRGVILSNSRRILVLTTQP